MVQLALHRSVVPEVVVEEVFPPSAIFSSVMVVGGLMKTGQADGTSFEVNDCECSTAEGTWSQGDCTTANRDHKRELA